LLLSSSDREILESSGVPEGGNAFSLASTKAYDSARHSEAMSVPCLEPVCVTDFETLAKAKMSAMAWEYVIAGAGDELTVRWNHEAYQRIRLKPRVLVDVSNVDTSVTLFGQQHPFPILLAPTAAQKLTHSEGELATVRGAGATGTTMVMSTFSNTSLEDAATIAKSPLWLQLYAQTDRGFTRELVQRAEASGCRALCLTIDTPTIGARSREERAAVTLGTLPNLKGLKNLGSVIDPTLSWKHIEWLLSFAKIPLLVKGVLNPDDADCAVKSGVAGIIVSNHGGRNLDTLPATIDALPHVADRVAGSVPIFVDGGIRRGTDVMKALALGANAVLIGRPYLYGLGAAGEAGVARVVALLQREFQMAMMLTGRTSAGRIDRSVIWS
jgi:4-hydroxymandelate oxidase